MTRSPLFLLVFSLLTAGLVRAQSPHEGLVLVNGDSHASRTLANHFVDTRGIPRQNVVLLNLPEPPEMMSPDMFE